MAQRDKHVQDPDRADRQQAAGHDHPRYPARPEPGRRVRPRRNELAGNLSLYQELHVIEKIDSMLDDGVLVGSKYRPITVRMIEMARSDPSLGAASKLNSPAFLDELIAQGKTRAGEFAAALRFESDWRAGDTDALAATSPTTARSSRRPPSHRCHGDRDRMRRSTSSLSAWPAP
jgi:hypothetical protein